MTEIDRAPFFRLCTLLVLALVPPGCRTYVVRPEPLTTVEIIELSRENRTPEEIIQTMKESRTVYQLKAVDVRDLLEKGVDERVVDEMLETRIRDLEDRYRYRYYPYPYYYRYPYYHPAHGPYHFSGSWSGAFCWY